MMKTKKKLFVKNSTELCHFISLAQLYSV